MPISPGMSGNPFEVEQQKIARQRALAQALNAQALKQPTGTQMVGNVAVRNSPFSGLAGIAQALAARKIMGEADEASAGLNTQIQARQGADMSLLANALGGRQAAPAGLQEDASGNVTPTDPVKALNPVQALAQALPMIQSPQLQQFGLQAQQGAIQRQEQQAFQAEQKEADRIARTHDRILALDAAAQNASLAAADRAARAKEAADLRRELSEASNQTRRDVAGFQQTAAAERAAEKAAEKKDVAFNQDKAMLTNMEGAMDRLATAANEVLEHPGLPGIVGLRGKVPNIPGSDAANAAALLQTLKAQVGFGVLQEMRNASKSGGALGSVTEKELGFLQNALAALDTAQNVDQFKKSLGKIMTYSNEAKSRLRGSFETKHNDRRENLRTDKTILVDW